MEIQYEIEDSDKEETFDRNYSKFNSYIDKEFNKFLVSKYNKYEKICEEIIKLDKEYNITSSIKFKNKNDIKLKIKNNSVNNMNSDNNKLISLYKFYYDYINNELTSLMKGNYINSIIKNRQFLKNKNEKFLNFKKMNKIDFKNESNIININNIIYENLYKNYTFFEDMKNSLLLNNKESLLINEKDSNINDSEITNVVQIYNEDYFNSLIQEYKEKKEIYIKDLKDELLDLNKKINKIKNSFKNLNENNLFSIFYDFIYDKLVKKETNTIANYPIYITIKMAFSGFSKLKKILLSDILTYINEENYIFKMLNFIGFFKYSVYPSLKINIDEIKSNIEFDNLTNLKTYDKINLFSIAKLIKVIYEKLLNLHNIENIKNNNFLLNYVDNIVSLTLKLLNSCKLLKEVLIEIQKFYRVDTLISNFQKFDNIDYKFIFLKKIKNFLKDYEVYAIKYFKQIYIKKKNLVEKLEKEFDIKYLLKNRNVKEIENKIEEEKIKEDFIQKNIFKIKDIDKDRIKEFIYCNEIYDLIYDSINNYNVNIDEYSEIKILLIILDSCKFLNIDFINDFLYNLEEEISNDIDFEKLYYVLDKEYNGFKNIIDKLNIHILKIYKIKNKCSGFLKNILEIKIESQYQFGTIMFDLLSIITLLTNIIDEFFNFKNRIDVTIEDYKTLDFLKYLYIFSYKLFEYNKIDKDLNERIEINFNNKKLKEIYNKWISRFNLNTKILKVFYKIPLKLQENILKLKNSLLKILENLNIKNYEKENISNLCISHLKINLSFQDYIKFILTKNNDIINILVNFNVTLEIESINQLNKAVLIDHNNINNWKLYLTGFMNEQEFLANKKEILKSNNKLIIDIYNLIT